MKPRHLTLAATLSGALVAPSGAQAHQSQLERSYEHAYRAVVRKLGTRAPGRNIVRWGTVDHRKAPSQMILRSLGVLSRMLHPAPVIPSPSPATVSGTPAPSASAPASSSQTAGGGLAACIIAHESGGNPQAVNGQYQGIGQWSPSAWAQDGGTQYAASPSGASYSQQVAVLNSEGAAGMQQQQGQFDGC